jgi:glycolate oxidase
MLRRRPPRRLVHRAAFQPSGFYAGENGVLRMLELLEDEVIRTLGLLGVTSFGELDKSYLHPASATNMPSVFSAYPLLDIEPYRY